MVKGLCNPSKENLTKILNNPHGWDTSMLIDGGIYAGNNNSGDVNVLIGHNRVNACKKDSDEATQIAVLEKENEMLREQLEFMKTLLNSQKKE